MKILFSCKGHPNILGTHKNTLEFTKDKDLTLSGDCIIGVDSDFLFADIKKILAYDRLRIILQVDELVEEIVCDTNKKFNDDREIVIRFGTYDSSRTLGMNADKSSKYLNRELMEKMKSPDQKMIVEIEGFNND